MSPMTISTRHEPVSVPLQSPLTLGLSTFIVCRSIELIRESKIRSKCSLTVSKRWWSPNGSICSPCLNYSNSSLANHPIWILRIWSELNLSPCEESHLSFCTIVDHTSSIRAVIIERIPWSNGSGRRSSKILREKNGPFFFEFVVHHSSGTREKCENFLD